MDKANTVVVYGAGGHSQVVTEVLQEMGFEVSGYLNDCLHRRHPAAKPMIDGIRRDRQCALKFIDGQRLILAVGNNKERQELAGMLGDREWVSAIHPTAIVSPSAVVGADSVLLHRAVIQANTRIGAHVLINTAASVDHDNVIGDFAHISPHATLCGHVEIGEGTHVGAGATIIPNVKIGHWCTIGAGAVVLEDVADGATVVGVPGRITKIDPVG